MNVKTIGVGFVLSFLFASIVNAEVTSEYNVNTGVENSIVNADENISTEKVSTEKVSTEKVSTEKVSTEKNGGDKSSTEKINVIQSAEEKTNTLSTTSLLASLKDAKPLKGPAVSDGAIGKMFFGLGGVLILIFSCSWMLKRFNINKFGMTNALSVSGVLPIGAKEKVVVVDIEGTRLVLGVTATNITKLHTLDAVDASEVLPDKGKKSPISSDFSEKMKKIMKEGLKSD